MKDRRDGYFIKSEDPFHSIVPYVMAKRTEAEVSATNEFDVTKLLKYLETYNKKNGTNIKLFHAFCMAAGKTLYVRPKMNIFIAGRRFYQRKDITLSFVAKQYFADEAFETLMCLKIDPKDDLLSISSRILGDVKRARSDGSNDLDKTMNFVGNLPRWILEIVFFVLRRLEYHGIFPEGLTKGDPNYSSILLANLGSIKAVSCYHHLSNYGTCSIMTTIGTVKEVDKKKILPVTITFDERIADGFYFAKSMRLVKYLLENPEELFKTIDSPVPEELFN